jgi:hypothetical protein
MFELFELFELFDYSFTDQQLVMRLSIFVHTRRYLIILLSYYLIILLSYYFKFVGELSLDSAYSI